MGRGSLRGSCVLLLAAVLFLAVPRVFAGEGSLGRDVGIQERLGSYVPLDLRFVDETDAPVSLRQLVRTPTILALVYYRCPNACDYLLTGMADALTTVSAEPGREYAVLTVSIDERETAQDAAKAKRIALESIQRPYPAEAWRFLRGSEESIQALADAVGFRFARVGDDYDHPLGIVILSPQGKIVRYMNGTEFLPVDLKMSIMEASTGTVRPTIAKVVRFCFSYNPRSHQFVFNTLKVSAIVIFLLAGSFVLYLVLTARRRRGEGVKR
jgi:protein SCO1/2